jgi:hypothetical protein
MYILGLEVDVELGGCIAFITFGLGFIAMKLQELLHEELPVNVGLSGLDIK